jgi:hypothetical protein
MRALLGELVSVTFQSNSSVSTFRRKGEPNMRALLGELVSVTVQSNSCVFSIEPGHGYPIQGIETNYIRNEFFSTVKICIVVSSIMTLCGPMGGINVTKEHGGYILSIEVTPLSRIKISECIRKCLTSMPLLNNEKKAGK